MGATATGSEAGRGTRRARGGLGANHWPGGGLGAAACCPTEAAPLPQPSPRRWPVTVRSPGRRLSLPAPAPAPRGGDGKAGRGPRRSRAGTPGSRARSLGDTREENHRASVAPAPRPGRAREPAEGAPRCRAAPPPWALFLVCLWCWESNSGLCACPQARGRPARSPAPASASRVALPDAQGPGKGLRRTQPPTPALRSWSNRGAPDQNGLHLARVLRLVLPCWMKSKVLRQAKHLIICLPGSDRLPASSQTPSFSCTTLLAVTQRPPKRCLTPARLCVGCSLPFA
ncbi:PREDICTED: translation initiation factor IF-2-like [Chinchilla lanigera]|uniref:translation initiation factor IF-2-like n=1 Tax=Chinchilla lanigera TaxID=34839 RepID=UPI000696CC30|nr:PREDICTED: translation initiation factor IF-2-like [Chinchilla lanigera]